MAILTRQQEYLTNRPRAKPALSKVYSHAVAVEAVGRRGLSNGLRYATGAKFALDVRAFLTAYAKGWLRESAVRLGPDTYVPTSNATAR